MYTKQFVKKSMWVHYRSWWSHSRVASAVAANQLASQLLWVRAVCDSGVNIEARMLHTMTWVNIILVWSRVQSPCAVRAGAWGSKARSTSRMNSDGMADALEFWWWSLGGIIQIWVWVKQIVHRIGKWHAQQWPKGIPSTFTTGGSFLGNPCFIR